MKEVKILPIEDLSDSQIEENVWIIANALGCAEDVASIRETLAHSPNMDWGLEVYLDEWGSLVVDY